MHLEQGDTHMKEKINYTPYIPGEKIRIIFIFQIASFWPTWESLFEALCKDTRFEVKLLLLKLRGVEEAQTKTAEIFLKEKKISYILFEEFEYEKYSPHYAVYQSPYLGQRKEYIYSWSAFLRRSGARIVYIPYGIEITNTESADYAHFGSELIWNSYRLYTFSEEMRKEYEKKCNNYQAVRAMGHPKFDGLFHRERFHAHSEVIEKAAGRTIILWKMHFPKEIVEKGNTYMVSPYTKEYLEFAKQIEKYTDIFFIFMPHPKFYDCSEEIKSQLKQIMNVLEDAENVYIDRADDYRISLLNSDAIIVDRSAVMVEAAAADVPVLYLQNEDYEEPLNPPIKKLINGYYIGTGYKDMVNFVELVRKGVDEKAESRNRLFKEVIPFFDGLCGERICEDLAKAVIGDDESSIDAWQLKGSRVLVWGTGYIAKSLYYLLAFLESISFFTVVAYVDNALDEQQKRFQGKEVISPYNMKGFKYDYVLLGVQHHMSEIHSQLKELGISKEIIIHYDRFLAEGFYLTKGYSFEDHVS